MTSQKEQKNNEPNDFFMNSIYNKVSILRKSLESSSPQLELQMNNFSATINNFDVKKNIPGSQNITRKFAKTKSSINKIKLNEQIQIDRQNLILNQRISHQSLSQKKMAKTFSVFSNFNQNNKYFSNTQNQFSSNSKNSLKLSEYNSLTNKKFQKKFSQGHNELIKQYKKLCFSAKLINKKVEPTLKQIKQKTKATHFRKESKMMRVLGFLGKNNSLKNKIQDNGDSNDPMKEYQELTQKKDKIQFFNSYSSDERIDNQKIIQGQNNQEAQNEQNYEFKPIGSAQTKRRLSSKQKSSKKVSNSRLNTSRENNTNKNKILIVQSSLQNYSKKQSQKKNYLQKGNRLREILIKKLLNGYDEKSQNLVYVREYDQWVPSYLVENNKEKLQTYLKLLLGEKKQIKTKKMTLNDAQIIYY